MAIKKEIINEEGKESITYTYSDSGFKIERDGILYDEAYDLTKYANDRIYTETSELIDNIEDTETENNAEIENEN